MRGLKSLFCGLRLERGFVPQASELIHQGRRFPLRNWWKGETCQNLQNKLFPNSSTVNSLMDTQLSVPCHPGGFETSRQELKVIQLAVTSGFL